MKNAKWPQPIVKRSITLPADLDKFAAQMAGQCHCGNISAYLRTLLHADWKKHNAIAVKRHG